MMETHSLLHSFKAILPPHHLPQEKTVDWIMKSHQRYESLQENGFDVELLNELRKYCLTDKYIKSRNYECDELDEDWHEHRIYKLTKETPMGAPIEERNLFFEKVLERVFLKLYPERIPKHLIHVTCTGYVSPNPAQKFFANKERAPEFTNIYHMGCYASIPAIRIAVGLNLSEKTEIDIVHSEICSLHLNPSLHTAEQMVVQSLFADGHIKYSFGPHKEGFLIKGTMEKLLPHSQSDMTWIPAQNGMMMTLSRNVPIKIGGEIRSFVSELAIKCGVDEKRVLKEGIFAVHPGGPSIIQAVEKKLSLLPEQIKASKKVLFERGNMSSATLPHVWKEILDEELPDGTLVLSLAFGPGLTIVGAIFELRKA